MPKFPEGKELFLINMADTHEIKHTLVPSTKIKSDLWKHFNLRERKTDGRMNADVAACKQCNFVVKLTRGTSTVSKHMKHHHPMSSFLFSSASRSGELRTQKLKSRLVRTQSLNVPPLKPGVGQYIAVHATLTARNFFLISNLPVHSPAFCFQNLSRFFSCVGCG